METPEMDGYTPEKKLSPRDMLVQSGIAERMIEMIKKYNGIHNPKITFGVEDCDFRVEQFGQKEIHTQVIIEMPDPNPDQPRVTIAFGVKVEGSFGATGEPPLTQEQLDTIRKILEAQK